MAEWHFPLEEVVDGLSLPQFRLLSKMCHNRIRDKQRWELTLVSFQIQSPAQAEVLEELIGKFDEDASVSGGTEYSSGLSKSYPLLHELTPEKVAGNRSLAKIVRFVTIKEEE